MEIKHSMQVYHLSRPSDWGGRTAHGEERTASMGHTHLSAICTSASLIVWSLFEDLCEAPPDRPRLKTSRKASTGCPRSRAGSKSKSSSGQLPTPTTTPCTGQRLLAKSWIKVVLN